MDHRFAIVTGASRGIGRAIATRLAADGHHVMAVARSAEPLASLVEEITDAGGSAEFKTCDVGDGNALGELVEEISETHGRLDVLVNNAGITRDGLILRMSDEDFDQVISVNLRSIFTACRAAARPMMKGRFGRIINVGSVSGIAGNAGQANYAAAKAGLIGFTKSIAKELGAKGVTANVVAPGFIRTDMTEGIVAGHEAEMSKRISVRRLGEPEDISSAVGYLASESAGYITGQVLVVDGGLVI
ncbi:MAG: 3-oxoacyl-[acyl-carrier-protein] reductase [Phycisphaerae bacterium]|nr:3-oxoacyl-[acyl-carrier-protein] reductase [Phycisphaerae bacterium]